MRSINRMLTAALVLALAATGCESGNPAGSGDGARLSLLLTDAPGDFESAEVEIVEIYLQGGDDDDEDDDQGRHVLYTGGETFDLLDLRNGVTAELADIEVPAGTYSQLRLVLGDVDIETEDGRTFSTSDGTLKCPSCAQSGLKIKLPNGGLRLDDGEQSVIIDFDVAQSFGHEAGNSGKWIMHPVITATKAEAAGSITGLVTLANGVTLPTCGGSAVTLASFVPTATFGDLVLTGSTDAAGNLGFLYVAGATYTVGFTQQILFSNGDKLNYTASPSVTSVQIAPGSAASVNYTITGATCQAAT